MTVLSIINFVFGGAQAIGVLFSLASLGFTVNVQGVETEPDAAAIVIIALINCAVAAALIISGIGCLNVQPKAGRRASNIYVALVAIRFFIQLTVVRSQEWSFNMFTIIGLLYPLLVLFFVNVVFRDVWRERKPGSGRHHSSRKERFPHVILIGINSIRQTLRSSGGITLFLAVMIIGLSTAQLLLLPMEFLNNRPLFGGGTTNREQTIGRLESMAVPLIGRILGNVTNERKYQEEELQFVPLAPQEEGSDKERDDKNGPRRSYTAAEWAFFLMRERPGFLSVLYLLFCLLLPAVLLFSGFNQISEDARNKGLRYLLMRTGRIDIFLGKYLGSVFTTFLLLVLLFACIIIYIELKLNLYAAPLLIRWGLRGLLCFFFISLPVVAVAVAFSGMIDSGIGSLGAGLGTLVIMPLLFLALIKIWEPFSMLQYLVPYKLSFYLFHPVGWKAVLAGTAMVGYATIYMWLGYLYFKRRDL